jgi:hypothetical protein
LRDSSTLLLRFPAAVLRTPAVLRDSSTSYSSGRRGGGASDCGALARPGLMCPRNLLTGLIPLYESGVDFKRNPLQTAPWSPFNPLAHCSVSVSGRRGRGASDAARAGGVRRSASPRRARERARHVHPTGRRRRAARAALRLRHARDATRRAGRVRHQGRHRPPAGRRRGRGDGA